MNMIITIKHDVIIGVPEQYDMTLQLQQQQLQKLRQILLGNMPIMRGLLDDCFHLPMVPMIIVKIMANIRNDIAFKL